MSEHSCHAQSKHERLENANKVLVNEEKREKTDEKDYD